MEINWKKYHRQILLKGFGQNNQRKLAEANVLLVGVGGLGCPALLYLAAAGVRHITIVDFDTVELSNLHRQILFDENDLTQFKAEVAAKKISQSYPEIVVIGLNQKLEKQNAKQLIGEADLVLDASDNFETRYLVDDVCKELNKPWVYGSVSRYEFQVSVFNDGKDVKPKVHYRDLFPLEPKAGLIEDCAEAGVIGALAGAAACLQVMEVIKLICGMGESLEGTLLSYNSLTNQFYHAHVEQAIISEDSAQEKLVKLRADLQKNDQQILHLLAYRKNLVHEIGLLKKELQQDIFQSSVWENSLNQRKQEAIQLGLNPSLIEELFELIHHQSLKDQEKLYGNSH
jgi:molybdopterin/thiamine biosynthesis adenylyltransferase/chorismate mutase